MPDPAGAPVNPMPFVRVDVDHRGRVATYLIDRQAFLPPGMHQFYAHTGDLLADLRALEAQDSPTEGSLVERVERLARVVAPEPVLEAAIGFFARNGENGLMRVTGVPQSPLPDNNLARR